MTDEYIATEIERITRLALMKNAATRIAVVKIPRGTYIATGRVTPQLTYGPHLTGGGNQINILGDLGRITYTEMHASEIGAALTGGAQDAATLGGLDRLGFPNSGVYP